MINQIPAGWVAVARDTFEYNMRPWVLWPRTVAPRLAQVAHPVDPRGQVLVPSQIHESFKKRRHFTPATAGELAAAGYPQLPREPLPAATSRVVPWRGVQPVAETPAIAQSAAA